MAEQPTTLFDPPAGDRPSSQAYQPGTWLAEPRPGDQEADAAPPSASRRLAQRPTAACCCTGSLTRSGASRVAGAGRVTDPQPSSVRFLRSAAAGGRWQTLTALGR